MFDGALDIFPARGLDQSILVSVLVGIFVLLVLTETLGWVWAGLVVPGYLASVFAFQPSSGIAICIEATLTFVVCRAISDVLSRAGGWSPFFGRERFFLIVLMSVLVRQACELWLLDDALSVIEHYTSLPVAHHELSSIGLVLVPLLANMAWKLTLPRAVWQVGVTVAITWAIVTLVLLPFTNLSYASLELTYENVALDFLGSPKAYIILLTSAFIAARFNLVHGWDYNGILVPSLLALTWFEPRLAVATVIESLILVFAAKAVLAVPMLKRRNLEGPRKLALVFTVGFCIKLAIGWLLVVWWPLLRLTDLFGFGYVLTSLIATKMLNLKKTGRVILPAVAVSLVGFVAGSGIGYGLEQLAPRTAVPRQLSSPRVADTTRLVRSPLGVAAIASARAQSEPAIREHPLVSPSELADYAAAWRSIDRWLATTGAAPESLLADVERAGLRLVKLRDDPRGCWALLERQELLLRQQGWGAAVLCPGARGPVLEVIRPRRERAAAYAAVRVCHELECAAIVFNGIDAETAGQAFPATFIEANAALIQRPIVELRAADDVAPGKPVLHVRHTLPDAVRVSVLWPRPLELSWQPPPNANELWNAATSRVVLRVHPDELWASVEATAPALPELRGMSVFGWVDQWRISSATPAPPSPTELLVLEEQLVVPLAEHRLERLRAIGEVAGALGHELRVLVDGAGPRRAAWVVSGKQDRGWFALVIATHPIEPLVIEVPRPRGEFGTGRIAAATWQASGAAGLLLDPEWADRSPTVEYGNPILAGEVANAFQAAHQALTRVTRQRADGAIVQLRGFAAWRPITDHVVVSVGQPQLDPTAIPPTIERLLRPTAMLGAIASGRPRWVDGSEPVAALSGAGTPQLLYAQALGVPFAMVWLSPSVRLRTLPQDTLEGLRARTARLGIVLVERSLTDVLSSDLDPGASPSEPLRRRLAAASQLAIEYAHTADVTTLALLVRHADAKVSLGWSPDVRAGYIVVEVREHTTVMRAAALLGATPGPPCVRIEAGAGVDTEVWRAIGAWCLRLEISGIARP